MRLPKKRIAVYLFVLFLTGCISCSADPTPFQKLHRIYSQKLQGKYTQCSRDTLSLIGNLADAFQDDPSEKNAAALETALTLAMHLSSETHCRINIPALLQILDRISKPAAAFSGIIKARIYFSIFSGKPRHASDLCRQAGVIDSWALIGPFENDRGSGFSQNLKPEKEFLPEKIYTGKQGAVSWRVLPVTTPAGFLDLHSINEPSEQALAYAVTQIHSDKDRTAVLRCGSNDGIKVWLNGTCIISRDIFRLAKWDQDNVMVELKKGPNILVIKSLQHSGPWHLTARLTDTQGKGLSGVTYTSPMHNTKKTHYPPCEQNKPKVKTAPDGAMSFLSKQKDFYMAFWYAYLYFTRNNYDIRQKAAAPLMEALISMKTDDPASHYLLAQSLLNPLAKNEEKDENRFRLEVEKTVSLDPKAIEPWMDLSRYYINTVGNYVKAEICCKKAINIMNSYVPARLLQLTILAKRDSTLFRELPKGKLLKIQSSDPAFLHWKANQIRSYATAAQLDAVYKKLLECNPADISARIKRINLLKNKPNNNDRNQEILKQYSQWHILDPFSNDCAYQWAKFEESIGRTDSALKRVSQTLALAPQNNDLLKYSVYLHRKTGKEKKALALLHTMLDINPGDQWAQRYLKLLEEEKESYEDRFQESEEEIEKLIAAALKTDYDTTAPNRLLLLRSVIRLQPDGRASQHFHIIAKILNHQGIRYFKQFYTIYFPGQQMVKVEKSRVYKPDGTREDATLESTGTSGKSEGRRQYFPITTPQVDAGYVIEIEYKIEDLKQGLFGPYFGTQYYMNHRNTGHTDQSELILIVPESLDIKWNHRNFDVKPVTSTDKEKNTVYQWTLSDFSRIEPEPDMQPWHETAPLVEISTYKDWQHFGTWWWNLIQKQYDDSKEMDTVISELIQEQDSDEEKVRKIYEFITKDIRYVAWEFGIHGYKPYRASTILSRRFGDCKDKSILMNRLLDKVGIQSYPVLVRATWRRGKQDMSVPVIAKFNHCISCVPSLKGGTFLDGTAYLFSANQLPVTDRGAKALVVYPDRVEFKDIPLAKPDQNSISRKMKIHLKKDGSALTEYSLSGQGNYSSMLRRNFMTDGKRKEILEKSLTRNFGIIDISNMTFSDMKDMNAKPECTVHFTIKSFLKQGEWTEACLFKNNVQKYAIKESRKYDIIIPMAPMTITEQTVYHLEEGMSAVSVPEKIELKHAFAEYSLVPQLEKNILTVTNTFTVRTPRITTTEYPAFRKFINAIVKAEKKRIVFQNK